MLEPKEVVLKTQSGEERTYTISKFPAIAGREIIAQYPVSAIPKIGEYKTNEELMLKLMAFVSVPTDGGEIKLTSRALVENHVPDWETLVKLEKSMIEYNCSFFGNGKSLNFLEGLAEKGLASVVEMLTGLLAQSLQVDKPLTPSSKKK